jgi:hypothetical protein
MTVAGWACGSRRWSEPDVTQRYMVLNVDWDRTANTLCFHHDRVFGHYAMRTFSANSSWQNRWNRARLPSLRSSLHRAAPGEPSSSVSVRLLGSGTSPVPSSTSAGAREIDRRSEWRPGSIDRQDSRYTRLRRQARPSFRRGSSPAFQLPDRTACQTHLPFKSRRRK